MTAVLIVVGLLIYFVPSFVANAKHSARTGAIFAVNLFLGWTFIGWLVALICVGVNA
ncbi:MAG: superinfection immunity protein [Candidatus Acidiferrales bacterium]